VPSWGPGSGRGSRAILRRSDVPLTVGLHLKRRGGISVLVYVLGLGRIKGASPGFPSESCASLADLRGVEQLGTINSLRQAYVQTVKAPGPSLSLGGGSDLQS
jgi:hypothetical protein